MALTYTPRTGTRLRRGPNGVPRGQVTEIQRGRMIAAAVEAVEEVGYSRMTVAQVIARARVSRKTFYDVFADREDCFLAAFDQAMEQVRDRARASFEAESSWREAIRAGLTRLLGLMDQEPALTKLCVVEALAAGERVLERRARIFEELAQVIDLGRSATGALDPPEVTAEGVIGAIFAVIHNRVLEGGSESLLQLLNPLMSMIVLPYLGTKASQKELENPTPEAPTDSLQRIRRRTSDPLEGLEMRLTYRTVRVLAVIAEHPGASNREIAEGSGIADQGQISKLLGRLARLELVENLGEGQERGAANAWYLTGRGAAVERATRPR